MNKNNIIIVGYPKSGTHWLCRLVSEMLQSPFEGDWGYNSPNSSSIDYGENISEYKIHKSHHPYNEIHQASFEEIFKLIYLIRDPRDVVISGMHYFSFSAISKTFLEKIPFTFIRRVIRKFSKILMTNKKKKNQMIRAVLNGDESISQWLKFPWETHYLSYLDKGVLFVRYEDLLHKPVKECMNILRFLGLNIPLEHIKNSIDNQSFQTQLKEAQDINNPELKKLLRKGTSGYWKEELNSKDLAHFKNSIKEPCNFYEF